MASNISKWQTRQGELKADIAQNQASASSANPKSAGVNAIPVASRQAVASTSVHFFFLSGDGIIHPGPLLTQTSIQQSLADCFT
jgi:hypothetical protein